jgi:hypothetical protein
MAGPNDTTPTVPHDSSAKNVPRPQGRSAHRQQYGRLQHGQPEQQPPSRPELIGLVGHVGE